MDLGNNVVRPLTSGFVERGGAGASPPSRVIPTFRGILTTLRNFFFEIEGSSMKVSRTDGRLEAGTRTLQVGHFRRQKIEEFSLGLSETDVLPEYL